MEERKTWYLCDPERNTDCRKRSCGWLRRGRCWLTSRRACAKTDENVAPLTSWDLVEREKLDRTIHDLARIWEVGIVNAREDRQAIHEAVGFLETLRHIWHI